MGNQVTTGQAMTHAEYKRQIELHSTGMAEVMQKWQVLKQNIYFMALQQSSVPTSFKAINRVAARVDYHPGMTIPWARDAKIVRKYAQHPNKYEMSAALLNDLILGIPSPFKSAVTLYRGLSASNKEVKAYLTKRFDVLWKQNKQLVRAQLRAQMDPDEYPEVFSAKADDRRAFLKAWVRENEISQYYDTYTPGREIVQATFWTASYNFGPADAYIRPRSCCIVALHSPTSYPALFLGVRTEYLLAPFNAKGQLNRFLVSSIEKVRVRFDENSCFSNARECKPSPVVQKVNIIHLYLKQ
jgi:hypothetical protein